MTTEPFAWCSPPGRRRASWADGAQVARVDQDQPEPTSQHSGPCPLADLDGMEVRFRGNFACVSAQLPGDGLYLDNPILWADLPDTPTN